MDEPWAAMAPPVEMGVVQHPNLLECAFGNELLNFMEAPSEMGPA